MNFKKSATLLHIVSLLTEENKIKFENSKEGDAIDFPFELQEFCLENDKKNELLKFFSERLIYLYGESKNIDYHISARREYEQR